MLLHRYTIQGAPIAQAPRQYSGKNIYDTQKQQKLLWQIELSAQHNDAPMLEGPIVLDCCFFFTPEQAIASKKRSSYIGRPHGNRPSLDDLVEWVVDKCHGVIYKDRNIVCSINAYKCYDLCARTEFMFRRMEDPMCPF